MITQLHSNYHRHSRAAAASTDGRTETLLQPLIFHNHNMEASTQQPSTADNGIAAFKKFDAYPWIKDRSFLVSQPAVSV